VLVEPGGDQPLRDLVGDELPGVHHIADLPAQPGVLRHLPAEHVPQADVHDAGVGAQQVALGALAAALDADDHVLAHVHTVAYGGSLISMSHALDGPADPEATPSDAEALPDGPVWHFLYAPRWVLWHVLMVVAFFGMLWLGDWQFHRAMGGNALSWAYTFEWPLFSGFAVVFWAKTIRDEFRIRRGEIPRVNQDIAPEQVLPNSLGSMQLSTSTEIEPYDPELAAYNAYLSRLNSEVKDHGKWHGIR
jgi:hypothetical protein